MVNSAVLVILLVVVGSCAGGFIPSFRRPQQTSPIFPSPVNCQYTRWTDWTECNEPQCGKQGSQSRTRQILVQAQFGGIPCDPSLLEEWRPCIRECAVDCVMGPWSEYSQCRSLNFNQPTCGLGQQQRSRQILVPASNGGRPCGHLNDVQTCDLGPCPQNCQMSQWEQWTSCQTPSGKSCGSGQRQRLRSIITPALNGGISCGPVEEWESCDLGECAVDCVMSEWGPFTSCETASGKSCGEGQKQRLRSILVQPRNGGKQCGILEEWVGCNLGPCQQNCEMGLWTSWSGCASNVPGRTCGFGSRQRSRAIITPPAFGGFPCESTEEKESCHLGSCAVDCVMSEWSQYSVCQPFDFNQPTCGLGQQQRSRQILVQPEFGGRPCGSLNDVKTCDLGPCPQNCQMSQWEQWTSCQTPSGKSCGAGQRQRLRSILIPASNGGAGCGQLEEWESCNAGPCPIDCVLGEWGQYSQCSAPCGGGIQTRRRPVLVQPQFGGKQCLPIIDSVPCATQPCFQPPSCIGRPVEFHVNPAEPCSDKFWKCVNQETHAHVCPSGLKFDVQTFRCLPSFQVAACRQSFF